MTDMRWSSRFLVRTQAGRALPGRPGVHRRRRRARALAARRPGHEHRHRRRDEPRLEARRRPSAGRRRGWLLDSYEGERHPVGAAVLRLTDAFNQLVLGRSAQRRGSSRSRSGRSAVSRRPSVHGRTPQPASASTIRTSATTTGWSASACPTSNAAAAALRTAARRQVRDGDEGACRAGSARHRACGLHRHPELPDAVLVRPDGYVAWASDTDAERRRTSAPRSTAGAPWHSRGGPANRTGSAWPRTPIPAPRIGQIGQKYQAPAVRPTASHTVEHDDDHRQVAGQMDLHTAARGCPPGGSAARVVAPQLGQRQIGDELSQLGGGVCGECGLQPGLVLAHLEVALSQRRPELVRGLLPLAVAGPDGRSGWGGHEVPPVSILTVPSSGYDYAPLTSHCQDLDVECRPQAQDRAAP